MSGFEDPFSAREAAAAPAPEKRPKASSARAPRPDAPGAFGMGARMAQMVRVDHAGEYGAVQIYRGQLAVFSHLPHKRRIAAQLSEMARDEQSHLDAFDALILSQNVRPTALAPIWNAAGFALGAVTALMGEKVAHAATIAVEEVIEEHYAAQEREIGDRALDFAAMIARFREEEVAHKDLAAEEGGREAPLYGLFSGAIKAGCRIAIALSQRV